MRRQHSIRTLGAVLIAAAALAGCSRLSERRLSGRWESEPLPKRTLVLRSDHSYEQRFTGKTLGVLSELLGPETGRWRVADGALLLERMEAGGTVSSRSLPLDELSRESVLLAGERWRRLP
jgi:hypothetical protein